MRRRSRGELKHTLAKPFEPAQLIDKLLALL